MTNTKLISTLVRYWEEFEEKLRALQANDNSAAIQDQVWGRGDLHFRGQSDSTWALETTLDRVRKNMPLIEYARIVNNMAIPQIEAFTGKKLSFDFDEYEKWLAVIEKDRSFRTPYGIECFSYLRHHGFPSPLLDWTDSPYVAAFFAFHDIHTRKKPPEYVSIFVCREPDEMWTPESPRLVVWSDIDGAFHARHYQQHSRYTVCWVRKGGDNTYYYGEHTDVAEGNTENPSLLWKFDIPTTESKKVMTRLMEMNINAHSLFGTEESLLEAIATDAFLLSKKP